MKRFEKAVAMIAAALFAASVGACSKQEEGSAEQVGREIDAAMQKSAEEMQKASEKMGQAMGKAAEQMGAAAHQMGDAMKDAGQRMQQKAADDEGHEGEDVH